MEPYVILGACSPYHAHAALQHEQELGLLLPCNVIVYVADGDVYASAVDPVALMSIAGNEELTDTAQEIKTKLEQSIDNTADL